MTNAIISEINVERVDETSVKIFWKSNETPEVSVYSGLSPQTIDKSKPIAEIEKTNSVLISGLDPTVRTYFEVVPRGAKGIIAGERKVLCEGTFNLRDLGGYLTKNHLRLKWGQLFRSDGLSGLTEKGQHQLSNIGIKKIFDFRTHEEIQKSPDRLPVNGNIEYLKYPVKHGEFNFVHVMKRLKQGDASWLTEDYMTRGYIRGLEEFTESWGNAFKHISQNGGTPSIFHCTGGKDRTGTFAALILLTLDVPEETIIYDHQLSNEYIKDMLPFLEETIRSYGIDPQIIEPYFKAPINGITELLGHIRSKYKSAENYFLKECGVNKKEIESFKKIILDK